MNTKYQIRCSSADQIEFFLRGIQKFKGDINLTIDQTMYDAKSLAVVTILSTGRPVTIEYIGSPEESVKFDEFISLLKD